MNQNELQKEWYSVNEAADELEVSRPTIYRWMDSGKLHYHYVGGRRRISRHALMKFLESGEEPDAVRRHVKRMLHERWQHLKDEDTDIIEEHDKAGLELAV